jgi:hypothetical protein
MNHQIDRLVNCRIPDLYSIPKKTHQHKPDR